MKESYKILIIKVAIGKYCPQKYEETSAFGWIGIKSNARSCKRK